MKKHSGQLFHETASPERLLREQAEQIFRLRDSDSDPNKPQTFDHLLHETQLDSIELELQNKHTQISLQQALQHYRTLYDSAPIGYVTLDNAQHIVECNTAFSQLLGATYDELAGQPFTNLIHHDDQCTYERHLEEAQNEAGIQRCELRLRHANSGQREVRLETVTWTLESPCYQTAVIDLTERNHYERERQALRQQMQERDHLESLALLAGGIAHDLNNIHLVIGGNIEMALEQLEEHKDVRCELENMAKAIDGASHLLKQVLLFARGGKLDLETHELNELIETARPLISSAVRNHISLNLLPSQTPVFVPADAHQLRQLLLNLTLNATEAMNEHGGMIQIETGTMNLAMAELALARISDTAQPGTFGFIRFTDNGPGMSYEMQRRIFEPYFSTKHRGRGLGLAMVRTIVRMHQAALFVDSTLGQGTVFTILLPQLPTPLEVANARHDQTVQQQQSS